MNCQICQRETPQEHLEKHHLVPRSKHGAKIEGIFVCIDCGNMVHKLFTNKQLAKEYNTLEKLLENEKINKWIEWVRKNKCFGICMKNKKRRG